METRCKCCGGKIKQSEASTMTYCKVCCQRFHIKTTNNEQMLEKYKEFRKEQPVYTYTKDGKKVLHEFQNNKPVKTVFTGMRHKKCVVCGKEFKTLSGGAKYCSDQCRNKAHKEKNND